MIYGALQTGYTNWNPYSPISAATPTAAPIDPIDAVTLGGDLNGTGDFLSQMRELKQAALRQRAVADLPTAAPEKVGLPADWQTMPLNDFLNTVAAIRHDLGPSKQGKDDKAKPVGGDTGKFGVNAHRYYNYSTNEWVNPRSVQIHEKGNWNKKAPTTWNSGSSNDVSASKDDAVKGQTYQVTVTWDDGTTKTWDYTNDGGPVDVWGPNT